MYQAYIYMCTSTCVCVCVCACVCVCVCVYLYMYTYTHTYIHIHLFIHTDKYELRKSYKAHIAPISAVALHPKKSIVATASDDHTWKMWSIPNGELILTGEGHKSWVSSIDFHPKAATLATGSGDCTVICVNVSIYMCTHMYMYIRLPRARATARLYV